MTSLLASQLPPTLSPIKPLSQSPDQRHVHCVSGVSDTNVSGVHFVSGVRDTDVSGVRCVSGVRDTDVSGVRDTDVGGVHCVSGVRDTDCSGVADCDPGVSGTDPGRVSGIMGVTGMDHSESTSAATEQNMLRLSFHCMLLRPARVTDSIDLP